MYNFAMLFTDRKIKNGTLSEKTSAGYSLHGGIVCFFLTNPIPHCFSLSLSQSKTLPWMDKVGWIDHFQMILSANIVK